MQRARFQLIVTIIVAVGALALTSVVAQEQNPRQLFERARMLDESNQNLTEAIKLYGQVVKQAQEQRALAARAQLRVGLLYERLGRKAEAQRAFQLVVNQYADQAEVVRQAQAKLPPNLQGKGNGSATGNGAGLRVRQVPVDYLDVANVSPDDRYFIGTDRETKDLILHDLMTGDKRRLASKPANKDEWFQDAIFSPDGKQIVTNWGTKKERKDHYELRIMGIDGSGSHVLYHNYRNDNCAYIQPYDWSPDGKYILTECYEESGNSYKDNILLISVVDGSARVVKSLSFEKKPGGLGELYFSPDGRFIAYSYRPQGGSGQRDISIISTDGSREVPLVESPNDDRLFGWTPDGKSILFSSDRSKTTDAWMIPVADGKPQGSPELVKRDIGVLWPCSLTRSGSFYYFGGSGQIRDIYSATLAPQTGKLVASPVQVKTHFIGSNDAPNWSPDGRYLVYRSYRGANVTDPSGDHQLIILNPETGEEREVRSKLKRFNSPLWFPDGKSLLVRDWSGTNYFGGTGLFKIDTETGDATLIAPEKPGAELFAPVLSYDGKSIFYQRENRLWRRNLDTGKDQEIYRPTPSAESRWSSNIALSPDGQSLAVKLGQSLIIIPLTGGDARELLKLPESELGASNNTNTIAWTPDGRYLLFVKNGVKQSELWRISTDGGEQQKLGQLMGSIVNLRVHPDGQRIVFALQQPAKSEVWVMENFLPAAQPRKIAMSRR